MRVHRFLAAAAVCGGIVLADVAQAEVANWPVDVPCSAISVNADGTYSLTTDVALINGVIFTSGTTFPSGGEYDAWARCRS